MEIRLVESHINATFAYWEGDLQSALGNAGLGDLEVLRYFDSVENRYFLELAVFSTFLEENPDLLNGLYDK